MTENYITLFNLYRKEDASGVSGTGVVAYGIEFPQPNGCAVLGWVTSTNSVAVYGSMDDIQDIHGHLTNEVRHDHVESPTRTDGEKTQIIEMDKFDVGHE